MPWPPHSEQDLARTCAALLGGEPGPVGLREAIRAGEDPLGQAFCGLRPPVVRRAMGAFFSPAPMVEAMVRWVLDQEPQRVVDCGCGSGRFAVALRRSGFEGTIVAVDLDPLAIAMTRAQLAVLGLAPVDLRCQDFLDLELGAIEGSTAFLGNPPYLRHHDLAPSTKAWARRVAADLGLEVSGLAGLHVLFLLAVAAQSRRGDSGCFVTSSEWMDVGYGALARGLLAGRLGLRFLAAMHVEATPFDDAMTTAVLFGWRAGSSMGAVLRRLERSGELVELERGSRTPKETLVRQARWSALLQPAEASCVDERVPLGSLARVHRGVATGHNGFFVVDRARGRELGLEPWLTPCLHRAWLVQQAGGLVRAEDCTHALLTLPDPCPTSPEVAAYLREGQARGVPGRYLCAQRGCWWRLPQRPPPPIVATYMARRPPSFALNPDGCLPLNVVHGIYPREPWEPQLLEALVAWLNAHAAELRGHRSYHGGLMKWEPRELEAALVPPLHSLLESS